MLRLLCSLLDRCQKILMHTEWDSCLRILNGQIYSGIYFFILLFIAYDLSSKIEIWYGDSRSDSINHLLPLGSHQDLYQILQKQESEVQPVWEDPFDFRWEDFHIKMAIWYPPWKLGISCAETASWDETHRGWIRWLWVARWLQPVEERGCGCEELTWDRNSVVQVPVLWGGSHRKRSGLRDICGGRRLEGECHGPDCHLEGKERDGWRAEVRRRLI